MYGLTQPMRYSSILLNLIMHSVTDDFTIDIAARRAFHSDGSEIYLTGVEFRMIEILLRHPGHVVSRADS